MGNKESNLRGSESVRSSQQISSSRMMKSSKFMKSVSKESKKDKFVQESTEIEKLLQLAGTFYMIGNEFQTYNLLSPYDGKLQSNSQDFTKVTTEFLIDIRDEISQQRRKTRRPFENDLNVTMELDRLLSNRQSTAQVNQERHSPPISKKQSHDFKKKNSAKQEHPHRNEQFARKRSIDEPNARDFQKKKKLEQPQNNELKKKKTIPKDERTRTNEEPEVHKKKSSDEPDHRKKQNIPRPVDSDTSNDKISRNMTPRSQVDSMHMSDEFLQKSGGSLEGHATSTHSPIRKPQIHLKQINDLTQSENIHLDRAQEAIEADSPRSEKQSVKQDSNHLQEFQQYVDDDEVPNLRTSRRLLQMNMSNITEKTEQQFEEDDEKMTYTTSPAVMMRKPQSRRVVMETQSPRSPKKPEITISPPSPRQERIEPKKTITAINVRPVVPPIQLGKTKQVKQPSRTPSSSRPNSQQRHLDAMTQLQRQINEAENAFYELLEQQIDFQSIFQKYQIKQPSLPASNPHKYSMGTVVDI